MKFKKNFTKLIAAGAILATASANAFMLDFTDFNEYGAVTGQDSFTKEYVFNSDVSLFVKLSSDPDNMVFSQETYIPSEATCAPYGIKCDGDGIGIGTGKDEIGKNEKLLLEFFTNEEKIEQGKETNLVSVGLNVDSLILLDLFKDDQKDNDIANITFSANPDQMFTFDGLVSLGTGWGFYDLNDDNWSDFAGQGATEDSFRNVSKILFEGDDFALAGLNVFGNINTTSIPIPEPETLALFGLGLALIGFRKKKSA